MTLQHYPPKLTILFWLHGKGMRDLVCLVTCCMLENCPSLGHFNVCVMHGSSESTLIPSAGGKKCCQAGDQLMIVTKIMLALLKGAHQWLMVLLVCPHV